MSTTTTIPRTSRETTSLDKEILSILASKPASLFALIKRLDADPSTITSSCQQLAKSGEIEPVPLNALDLLIIDALAHTKNHELSTAELANSTKEDRNSIYRRCQKFERKFSILTSRSSKSDKPLYFFPTTGDVITNSNFTEAGKVIEDLKNIVRNYPIARGKNIPSSIKEELHRDFSAYLRELSRSHKDDSRKRGNIDKFRNQILKVLSGTKKSDVTSLFGIRKFKPRIRKWLLNVLLSNGGILPGDVIYAKKSHPSSRG